MGIVKQPLAQKMVDFVARIIERNINIMDEAGVIIASSDPDRVGQLHLKALSAIRNDRPEVVEVDGNGMKRGINVPIHHHDQICGVVGVSGDVEEIRQIIDLVQCSIELLIEQEAVMSLVQVRKQLREQLLYEWVYRQVPCSPAFISRGEHCGVSVQVPRRVALIRLSESSHENSLEHHFETSSTDSHCIRLSSSLHVLIMGLQQSTSQQCEEIWELDPSARIGVGESEEIIHTSLLQAQSALGIGGILNPQARLYEYRQYHCFDLILRGKGVAGMAGEFTNSQIFSTAESREHVETLLELFRRNGNLTLTAEALHVHRNTIRYRMERLHQVTGLNPFVYLDLFHLICGYVADKESTLSARHVPLS